MNLLIIIILTLFVVVISFIAMGVGLIIKGKKMRGGCGSKPEEYEENGSSCEFCAEKRKLNLCSSSDSPEMSKISKISTLSRFQS